MKVKGGILKGEKLKVPSGLFIRPTADKVKGAIFDILQKYIQGRDVLELFAGCGAIGIEALSRGAASCVFVDNNTNAIKIIKENLRKLKINNSAQIIKGDVQRIIKILSSKGNKFDLIFADPPYGMGLIEKTIILLSSYDICKDGCIFIAEHDIREKVSDKIGLFSIYKKKRYGDTIISIFLKEVKNEGGSISRFI